jgi:HlyD family secretion protein
MKKLVRLLVLLVFVVGGGIAAYAWFSNRTPADAGLKTVKIELGSITEKALATGQIEPREKFTVKSKISGIVRRVFVEVGDTVERGDPLFEIAADPTPAELLEAERRQDDAKTRFQKAESDWVRMQQLHGQGVVSRTELDQTRESWERTQIELKNASDSMQLVRKGRIDGRGREADSVIRATAAGTVLSRAANVGDPVVPLTSYQPGTELAVIADMRDLVFRGTVDEIDVGKLALSLPVRLKIGSLPDAQVGGRLARIAPQARERDNARLFDVEIELAMTKDVVLRAGYSATADLVIREKRDVVVVPERLVTFEENGAKAFVEIPGPTPEAPPTRVEIKTGLSDGLNIEVISGLEKDALVIERPPREILG